MSEEKCETCRFWKDRRIRIDVDSATDRLLDADPSRDPAEARRSMSEWADEMAGRGECRRLPPQIIAWPETPRADADCDSRWPHTDETDWCGEWQPRRDARPE